MTFDARERSRDAGQPVLYYEFQYGPTYWRYTSADRDTAMAAKTWESLPGGISDEGIRQSGDPVSDALTIAVPVDLPVVALYRSVPPTEEVAVIVRAQHHGDLEAPVIWVGSVSQANRRGAAVELVCESLLASMARGGLSLGWERNCIYALYDHNCRVNRELFRVPGTLLVVGGNTVEAAAFGAKPAGWFAGGFIEYSTPEGVSEKRFVKSHAGSVLTLLGGVPGLAVGQAVDGFAGCDRRAQTCLDKFANLDNNGGIPMLPGKSPFDGTLVF